jgi:hypothetical protein
MNGYFYFLPQAPHPGLTLCTRAIKGAFNAVGARGTATPKLAAFTWRKGAGMGAEWPFEIIILILAGICLFFLYYIIEHIKKKFKLN